MLKSTLILGGAGFVGSHLVDLCLRRGMNVWIFDNFSVGRWEFLQAVDNLCVEVGDILDTGDLEVVLQECKPQIVFHLAAIHHIPTCEKHPRAALRTNIEGTHAVLEACARNKIPRLVFASTGALYDPAIDGALHESASTKALDIYSISKLAGEHLIHYYAPRAASGAVVARLFNTVGRRETNAHIIPTIMAQLAEGKREIRLGNLLPRRDFIHVEDVAEGLYSLGTAQYVEPFNIFNLGSGREYSVADLVELCSQVVGEPLQVFSDPALQRKVDRPRQLADITKIRQATGWEPRRNLKQALSEIWEETLLANKIAHG